MSLHVYVLVIAWHFQHHVVISDFCVYVCVYFDTTGSFALNEFEKKTHLYSQAENWWKGLVFFMVLHVLFCLLCRLICRLVLDIRRINIRSYRKYGEPVHRYKWEFGLILSPFYVHKMCKTMLNLYIAYTASTQINWLDWFDYPEQNKTICVYV